MIKTFITITILAALLALSSAQPDVRQDINGNTYNSNITNWNCNVDFIRKGKSVKSEQLTNKDDDASARTFGLLNTDNDDIDAVSWSGTSCQCWIVLFEDRFYDGASLALWTTNSTQGSYDLTTFAFMEDKRIIRHDKYEQWNEVVSSYHIYCF